MSYQYPFIPGHSSMPATPQTTFRWDDGDQHQQQQHQHQQQERQHLEQQVLRHPLQHQPDPDPDVHVTVPATSTTTVHTQEHVPIVPSQNLRRPGSGTEDVRDEPPLRLQHVSVPALLQPEHMRPPMIDTSRAYHVGASASPSSGPPSADPTSGAFHGSIGPMRARISPVHTDPRATVHPYRRPQSAAGVVIARSRRDPEEGHSVRYSSSRQGTSSSASLPAPPLSIATATATSIATPRISGFPSGAVKNMTMLKGLINPGYSTSAVNVVIRTDLHFNHETNVLTALCELPGRSKSDVTVVLSTNPMNRVKQVVVSAKPPRGLAEDDHGHSSSSGDGDGYVLRERRSGPVSRTFVVPSTTTPDDVSVEMHDGLLSLKIQCPPPLSAREDDAQEIMIRSTSRII